MMLSKNLLASLTACILLGIASATMHSSIQTWSTEVFPVLRSLAISLFAAFLFLGGSASSQLNGSLVDQSKYTWLFGQSLLLFLIIATFGAGFRRRLERQISLRDVN
jgi:MFS family permease